MATLPSQFQVTKANQRALQKFDLREIPNEWQKSWPIFAEAIELLFGKIKYLEETAKITAFLSDTICCSKYLEQVDRALGMLYISRQVSEAKNSPRRKLSASILILAEQGGFSQMKDVVLTGDAGLAFARITGNKILFKDGLSKVHGEFTHSLQWLAVIKAAGELQIPIGSIADIYAQAGTTSTIKKYVLTGEKAGGKGKRFEKAGLFDFVCDAFLFQDGDDDQTFLLHNLFSKSARSPAFISKLIEGKNLPFLYSYYYGDLGKYTDKKRNNLQEYREKKVVTKGAAIQQIGNDKAYAPPGFLDLPDPLNLGKVIGQSFDPHYLQNKK